PGRRRERPAAFGRRVLREDLDVDVPDHVRCVRKSLRGADHPRVMGPLFALSLAALAAAPVHEGAPVAVLVVRRTSVDAQAANALGDWVAQLLQRAGVAVEPPDETARRLSALGVKDTTRCGGRRACVLELLRQLERPAGVALSISQLGSDRSVVLEA